MSFHPELSWQLAQAKIDVARSGAQGAPARRAAALDRQVPAGTRRALPLPAILAGLRGRPRAVRLMPRR